MAPKHRRRDLNLNYVSYRTLSVGAPPERRPPMAEPEKPTALVVEDDLLQRMMIADLIEGTEMNVVQCESGEAATLVQSPVAVCL